MNDSKPKVLVIGFGNPGRLDDGLGPALAAMAETWRLEHVTVDANYQLTVEDAAAAAEHDAVILADATVADCEPFSFTAIEARSELSFSTHEVSPEALMGMARDMFHSQVKGYMLAIRGYEFNAFGEWLSQPARENLQSAATFLAILLESGHYEEAAKQQLDHGLDQVSEQPESTSSAA